MPGHVVLIGDSIFDNRAYVPGEADVSEQLRELLGDGWRVTLAAVDGSICTDALHQLHGAPADATHLVISAGGNDILHHVALLEQAVGTVGGALGLLRAAVADFVPGHEVLVRAAGALAPPVAFCTIYDGNKGELVATGIAPFNDAITRNVHAVGLDLIDLRLVCSEPADYANPIEPSYVGGAKIARAIARYVREVHSRGRRSRVFS